MSKGIVHLIYMSVVSIVIVALSSGYTCLLKPFLDERSYDIEVVQVAEDAFGDFCSREPSECKTSLVKQPLPDMTIGYWGEVILINEYVNISIKPVSDMQNWGVADYWTANTDSGDCDDIVLVKKQRLITLGFSPDSLNLVIVRVEKQYHLILLVESLQGGFILDNLSDKVIPVSEYPNPIVAVQTVDGKWVQPGASSLFK
jgi:predicted transglutaminase-like cysteine proteinase